MDSLKTESLKLVVALVAVYAGVYWLWQKYDPLGRYIKNPNLERLASGAIVGFASLVLGGMVAGQLLQSSLESKTLAM